MNLSFLRSPRVVLLLVTLLLALGYGSAPALAQATDPQSLVGEWIGQWSSTSRPQVSGPYSLLISKVDGAIRSEECELRICRNARRKQADHW